MWFNEINIKAQDQSNQNILFLEEPQVTYLLRICGELARGQANLQQGTLHTCCWREHQETTEKGENYVQGRF